MNSPHIPSRVAHNSSAEPENDIPGPVLPCVIVVDDDDNLLKVISRALRGKGYECVTENSGFAALMGLSERNFDVALLDLEMPDIDGFQILAIIRQNHPEIVPIVLTGGGNIPRAVDAMKLGAFDFLEKPCNPHLLESTIKRAVDYHRARIHAKHMEKKANESQSALQMEREASQSKKLESVGRLAAGIAHEINTPAQYVGDNIEFFQIAYESISALLTVLQQIVDATTSDIAHAQLVSRASALMKEANLEYLMVEIPRAIEQSLEGVGRISSIVQAMKEFSHPGMAEKTSSDLNQCIRSTITVSRNEWKYVANLEANLDYGLPFISCYPGELNQVFLNLIVNAAHAISDIVGDGAEHKGMITVSTRLDGEWVEVRISDTGAGIPEDIRECIFDPFFTTKGVGRGTGQGLAIARNVVVGKHGGIIRVESNVGKGTTFVIRLPLDADDKGNGRVS